MCVSGIGIPNTEPMRSIRSTLFQKTVWTISEQEGENIITASKISYIHKSRVLLSTTTPVRLSVHHSVVWNLVSTITSF